MGRAAGGNANRVVLRLRTGEVEGEANHSRSACESAGVEKETTEERTSEQTI